MIELEKIFYRDLNLLRQNIIGSFLNTGNPSKIFATVKKLPYLIHKNKFESITKAEEQEFLEAGEAYKNILQSILSKCVSNMYETRGALDLKPLFQFIFGGDILADNRFSDHVTNKVYSSFLDSLYVPGKGYSALTTYAKCSKEEILQVNNFNTVDIRSSEDKYIESKSFPGHSYILLAFTYNYSVVADYSEAFYQKISDDDKKYMIFVDYYGYSNKIYTLKLDCQSTYTDIFFRLCLDEQLKKLGAKISSINPSGIKRTPNVVLHDPSERNSNKK